MFDILRGLAPPPNMGCQGYVENFKRTPIVRNLILKVIKIKDKWPAENIFGIPQSKMAA